MQGFVGLIMRLMQSKVYGCISPLEAAGHIEVSFVVLFRKEEYMSLHLHYPNTRKADRGIVYCNEYSFE